MQNSITSGIVSAVEREVTDSDGKKYVLIQTDAAINSGNSGGALVNSKGEVIGINTLKLSGTGIEGMGFAIPINDTKDIAEQLIQYNKVKRPYIGISGIDIDEAKSKQYNYPLGIYIRSIEDFSAAQKAGLKVGDIIVEADGKTVQTMDELTEIKNTHKIGDEMTLKINRDGKKLTITCWFRIYFNSFARKIRECYGKQQRSNFTNNRPCDRCRFRHSRKKSRRRITKNP